MRGTWRLKLRMWLTMFLMFSIVYFILTFAGWYLGIGRWQFFMVISLGIVFLQYWFGPSLVKRSMNVRPLSETEAPHIHQMVSELAQAANVPKPEVCISEINIPNAFAYGRSSRSGHIAITRPILGLLDRDELRAVLGHEMGHIKHNDMMVTAAVSVVPMICYYVAISFMFSSSFWYCSFQELVSIMLMRLLLSLETGPQLWYLHYINCHMVLPEPMNKQLKI